MTFYLVPNVKLRDNVVNQIRLAIIEGRLNPGDHVTEALLSEQMGVSRTPVREALILLEREGLIVALPNRGFYVREYTVEDVGHIFSMRIVLENYAAELNINRLTQHDFDQLDELIERQRLAILANDLKLVRSIDMDFHRYIVAHSRHPLLLRNWTEFVAQIAALLYLRAESVEYDEMLVIGDHVRILDGYKRRDLEEVQRANREINNRVCGECVIAVRKLARK